MPSNVKGDGSQKTKKRGGYVCNHLLPGLSLAKREFPLLLETLDATPDRLVAERAVAMELRLNVVAPLSFPAEKPRQRCGADPEECGHEKWHPCVEVDVVAHHVVDIHHQEENREPYEQSDHRFRLSIHVSLLIALYSIFTDVSIRERIFCYESFTRPVFAKIEKSNFF